jgi:hypothetical protein
VAGGRECRLLCRRFDEVCDKVVVPFGSVPGQTKETLKSLIENLGLDVERFGADRQAEVTLASVKADIDLGIDGTPSVLLNGRRVYDTRSPALEYLITHTLEHDGDAHSH